MAAAIPAALSIGSSIIGGNAARKASNKQAAFQNQANDALNTTWDAAQENLNPYMKQGTQGFNILANMLNTGDMSKFFESPQYQFALQQGLKGQQSSAGLRGLSTAPRTAQDLGNYAQNMASGEFQNYLNNMSGLGNTGYNAASQLSSLGMGSYAPAIMGGYNNLGNIYAQKNLATGASNQGILGGLGSMASMMGGGYSGGLGGLFGGSGLANNAGLRTALTGQQGFVGPLPY